MFGCRDQIITWNNIIIDGHNRYELCNKNGIQFETLSMDYEFEDEEEVKQWIIKNQFARRNISSFQRSELALQLKESIAKKAKENQSLAGGDKKSEEAKSLYQKSDKVIEDIKIQPLSDEVINEDIVNQKSDKWLEDETKAIHEPIEEKNSVNTLKEVAKVAGVSHDTIHKVEVIVKEAPEVIKEAARDNDISINKAYNFTKEVKDLEEGKKESKAAELLNQQYDTKAKEIDKQKKIADKIADVIFGILTTTIDEERMGYYLEYSPQESLDKHISRCDEAIEKLQQVKSIFENMGKIKVVK